jgi:hypothetical protein
VEKYWSVNQVSSHHEAETKRKKSLIDYKSNLLALVNKRTSFNIKNFFSDISFGFNQASHHVASSNPIQQLPISTSSIHSNFLIRENHDVTDKYWLTHQLLKLELNQNKIRMSEKSFWREWTNVNLKNEVALKMSHFLTYKNFSGLLTPQLFWRKHSELFFEFLVLQDSLNAHTAAGYMLYRLENKLLKGTIVFINTKHIRDYALVICNLEETLLMIDSLSINTQAVITLVLEKDCQQFDVIVESLGRMSDISKAFSSQRKGYCNYCYSN